MRQVLLAGMSVVGLLATATPSFAAESRYCLQGTEWGYPGNCQFSTYEQCMASASGTGAYCGINPAFGYARQGRYYVPAY
jgi:hypothetical protein